MANATLSEKNIERLRSKTLGSATVNDVVGVLLDFWEETCPGQVVLKQGRRGAVSVVGKKQGTVIV